MSSGYRASVDVNAPCRAVYEAVTDVLRTPDRSPECRRVEWLEGFDSPIVGARFRGRNRWRGFVWWRKVEIIQADPNSAFVFRTIPGRGIFNDATTWAYTFEDLGSDRTRVTESYEFDAPGWLNLMDRLLGRPGALRRNVDKSLATLKKAREAEAAT